MLNQAAKEEQSSAEQTSVPVPSISSILEQSLEEQPEACELDDPSFMSIETEASVHRPNHMMERLYQSKQTMDVIIRGRDGYVRAHACVLMAGSPFFESALKDMKHFLSASSSYAMKESSTGVIDFSKEHSSLSIRILVKYIYLSKSSRPQDSQHRQIADLISLCKKVGGEAQSLLQSVSDQLCSGRTDVKYWIPYYLLAAKYDLLALRRTMASSIFNNFTALCESSPESLFWLPLAFFSMILRNYNFKCDENVVFSAAMNYVRPLEGDEQRIALDTLLPLVRFDLLSPEGMAEAEKEPLLPPAFMQELYRNIAHKKVQSKPRGEIA